MRLMQYLEASDFSDDLCRRLAGILYASWRAGETPQAAELINRFTEEEEEAARVSEIFSAELPEELSAEEKNRLLAENVRRIKRGSLDAALRAQTDGRKLQEIIQQKAKWEKQAISLID